QRTHVCSHIQLRGKLSSQTMATLGKPLVSLKQEIDAAGDSDQEDDEPPTIERLKSAVKDFDLVKELGVLKYKYGIFVDFTWREMRKRKVSYCLGTCSCFLVVFMTALLITTLANVPAVFLRLAEIEEGERDIVISAGGEASGSRTIDFTVFADTLKPLGDEYDYHSPRFSLQQSSVFGITPASCPGQDMNVAPLSWAYESEEVNCSDYRFECISVYCQGYEMMELHAINTAREDRMGFGRSWSHGKIPKGRALVESGLARRLNLEVGDTLLMVVYVAPTLLGLLRDVGLGTDLYPYSTYKTALVPVVIEKLVTDTEGKLPTSAEKYVFMELDTFAEHVADYLHPDVPDVARRAFAQADINKYATEISINLSPNERRTAYLQSNYDDLQLTFVEWAATMLYVVGFNQVDTGAKLLEYLQEIRFFSLFLGLIISLVILVLVCLAILLIYSLLMINVETRTFELGVLRMIGMRRADLVQLVLTQAFLYALPAWVIGLLGCYGVWLGLREFLNGLLLLSLPTNLDSFGVGMATLVGLLMPLVAAIVPIRHALGMNLQDSLDTTHSKVKAVSYTFDRSEGSTVSASVIILGVAMSLFGFLIYYLFPLALLSFNIALLFYIFFGILLALLFGLILLALNFEHLLENFLTHVVLFWENYAVRQLILKNLVSHRNRNRKTTLMYATSLGFIIWINVSWALQIQSVEFGQKQKLGGSMLVEGDAYDIDSLAITKLEKVLSSMPDLVEDWGYDTYSLDSYDDIEEVQFMSIGRYKQFDCRTKAISPNFLEEVTDTSFMVLRKSNSSHGSAPSNQLYSRSSTDKAILGSLYYNEAHIDGVDSEETGFVYQVTTIDENQDETDVITPMRAGSVMDSIPVLRMSQFPSVVTQDTLVSMPTYLALSSGKLNSVGQVIYWRVVLKLASGWTSEDAERIDVAISQGMEPELPSNALKTTDLLTATESTQMASTILTAFFMVITLIAMTMCFFSLMASMFTNINEQSKEIGILRSLGLGIPTTKRVYIWEAFILVTAASVMGFFVGTLVAYTMVIQRQLFLQLPLVFEFPWALFLFVVLLAFIFAVISSYGPSSSLLKNSIVSILRKLN
ncbi:hypothetical protein DIPPA_12994, partial [Diplonema papillatum]